MTETKDQRHFNGLAVPWTPTRTAQQANHAQGIHCACWRCAANWLSFVALDMAADDPDHHGESRPQSEVDRQAMWMLLDAFTDALVQKLGHEHVKDVMTAAQAMALKSIQHKLDHYAAKPPGNAATVH